MTFPVEFISLVALACALGPNAQGAAVPLAGQYVVRSCTSGTELPLPKDDDGLYGEATDAIGHAREGDIVAIARNASGDSQLNYAGVVAHLKRGTTTLSSSTLGGFNHVVVKESVGQGLFTHALRVTIKSTIQSILWPSPRAKASWSFEPSSDSNLVVRYSYTAGSEHHSETCELVSTER